MYFEGKIFLRQRFYSFFIVCNTKQSGNKFEGNISLLSRIAASVSIRNV